MYKFSIIIPHKNIPDLLQRCLDSIPVREDIQTIIVDDDSDPAIVDFEHFPGLGRPNTEVYFDKKGKGAGHARNVGLEHAKGEWLLFADADDFFEDGMIHLLEKYMASEADIIFFQIRGVMSDDISKSSARDSREAYFHQYYQGHDESALRMECATSWGRMIRRKFVVRIGAKFDETRWSNDFFFCVLTGVKAGRIDACDQVLYIVTERSGSLISNFCGTYEEWKVRMSVALRVHKLVAPTHYIQRNGVLSFLGMLRSKHNGHLVSGVFFTILHARTLDIYRMTYNFIMPIIKGGIKRRARLTMNLLSTNIQKF